MFRQRVTLVAAVVVLVTAAWADAATVEEIISKVEARSATIKDMQGKFDMQMSVMNQEVKATGTLKMIPAQNKFAMDMNMTMMGMDVPMKMVCDGREMFQRIEVGGQVMVNKVDMKRVPGLDPTQMAGLGPNVGGFNSLGGDPAQSVEALKKFMDLKVVDDPEATLPGGEKAWVLEGKFKPEYFEMMQSKGGMGASAEVLRSQFAGMRIYVGQESHYFNRMVFLSSDNKETGSMTFSELKFNEGIPLGEFRYTPPEGTPVRDLTDMLRAKVKKMGEVTSKADRGEKKTPEGPMPLLKIGEKAVAFKVKLLDGREIELTTLRGKPVVLFFWATWHPGSIEQLVEVSRLVAAHGTDVRFVALSLNELGEEKKVREVIVGRGMNLPAALIPNSVFDAYAISELPCWVVLDAEGRVLASEARPKGLDGLKKALEDVKGGAGKTAAAVE